MDERGKQICLDIWLDEPFVEETTRRVEEIIRKRFSVVREARHRFEPQGETVVFILSESHFTLHTYPEHNYISLDIYVCDLHADVDAAADEILASLKVKSFNRTQLQRGFRPADTIE